MISAGMSRFGATAVAVLLWCGQARADGTGVLVLGEPTLQQPVRAMLLGWLKEHGHTIIPSAFDGDAQSTFANCFVIEDLACARGVFEQRGKGDSLVYARVELQPGKKGRHVVITGYWFVKEHDAIADKRACTQCEDKALTAAIGSMMDTLAKGSGLDKGRVKLQSKPSGLVVMLDDIKIGVTPIEKDLGAGPHTIKLLKDGKVAALKDITVSAGGQSEYTLSPTTTAPQVKVVEKVEVVHDVKVVHEPSRALPIILFIGGLGAAGTGGVMMYYGAKSGPDEPFKYTTATRNGEIIGAAGSAALLLGAILWFTAKPTETGGPTAAPTPGGATVGWAGSF